MKRPGERGYGTDAVWAADGTIDWTYGIGAIPARCPYKAGDWVQLHGYPGCPPGSERWGFRGFVLGGFGNTLICGRTDDGRQWVEPWAHLVPDGTSDKSVLRCTCCPPPPAPRRARRARPSASVNRLDELVQGMLARRTVA